jgi:hypothetical protein
MMNNQLFRMNSKSNMVHLQQHSTTFLPNRHVPYVMPLQAALFLAFIMTFVIMNSMALMEMVQVSIDRPSNTPPMKSSQKSVVAAQWVVNASPEIALARTGPVELPNNITLKMR